MKFLILTLLAYSILTSGIFAHAGQDPLIWPGLKEGRWFINIEVSASDGIIELREDPAASSAPREWLLDLTASQWKKICTELESYLRDSLLITDEAGSPLRFEVSFPNFSNDPPTFREGEELILDLIFQGEKAPSQLSIQWISQWSQLLIATGMEADSELFTLGLDDQISFTPSTLATIENPFTTSLEATEESRHSFLRWIEYGFIHVIPAGLDHILFILGFCLCSQKLKPLLGYSLLFTLAHSLSLGTTVLGWIPPLGKGVELMIALSILWVGIEAFFKLHRNEKLLGGIVFFFGIIHGLGFAGALGQGLLSSQQIFLPLLGANLGIEIAQILVMGCYATLFAIPRINEKTQGFIHRALSLIVIVVALKFSIERLPF